MILVRTLGLSTLVAIVGCLVAGGVLACNVTCEFSVWEDPAGIYDALLFAEITNPCFTTADDVLVKITRYDADHEVLDTTVAELLMPLPPGESVPLVFFTFKDERINAQFYSVAVQARATSARGTTRKLYVENAALHLTSSGRAQFSGYIVNTGQRTIDDYWVGVLLYDASGKIVGGGAQLFVKYWPVRPSERTPFSFEVYYGSPDFVSRKVFVFEDWVWAIR